MSPLHTKIQTATTAAQEACNAANSETPDYVKCRIDYAFGLLAESEGYLKGSEEALRRPLFRRKETAQTPNPNDDYFRTCIGLGGIAWTLAFGLFTHGIFTNSTWTTMIGSIAINAIGLVSIISLISKTAKNLTTQAS